MLQYNDVLNETMYNTSPIQPPTSKPVPSIAPQTVRNRSLQVLEVVCVQYKSNFKW